MRSCFQVFCGLLVLAVAVIIGVVVHLGRVPSGVNIELAFDQNDGSADHPGGENPAATPRGLTLTHQQLQDYHRDGFAFIPQLLTSGESDEEDEARLLKDAAEYASGRNFNIFGLIPSSQYKKIMFDLWRTSPEIAALSLDTLPQVAAQLLRPPPRTTASSPKQDEHPPPTAPFRLLRDAYFAYAPPGEGCGWHVDDEGFFPADVDSKGPTFWITLDPLRIKQGGGLAVLNRTRFEEQRLLDQHSNNDDDPPPTEEECRAAIRGATCDMETKSPICHFMMEAAKMEFDMQPGDALVWDRWTFHRGVPATADYSDPSSNHNAPPPRQTEATVEATTKRRYSVRYVPHGAKAAGAVHASMEQGQLLDSPYYPQVWPSLVPSEMEALKHGLDQDIKLSTVVSFMVKRMAKRFVPFLFTPEEGKEESDIPKATT